MAFTYTECVLSSLEQLSLCPAYTSLLFESNIHIQVCLSSWNIKVWSLLICDISNLVDLLFAAFTPLNVFCCLRIVVCFRLDATWDVGEYLHQLREISPSWSQLFWKVWARRVTSAGPSSATKVFATTKNPWIEMIRIDFSFRLYRLRTLKAKNV